MRSRWRRWVENSTATVLAILLHAVAGVLIFFAFKGNPTPKTPPKSVPVIEAVVLDESRIQQELTRLETAEQERRAALNEAEEKRKREEQRLEEIKRAQAEAEKKRRAEQEELARIKKQAAEAEAEAKRKAEAEAKRKAEAEAKRKAEAEAKRKAEEDAARKRLAESLRQQAKQRQLDSLTDQYIKLIEQRIQHNWLLPPGSRQGLVCLLHIKLDDQGHVLDVNIARSSGDPKFDRSAIAAVLKAEPLPIPKDPDAMALFRSFNFKFNPGD